MTEPFIIVVHIAHFDVFIMQLPAHILDQAQLFPYRQEKGKSLVILARMCHGIL